MAGVRSVRENLARSGFAERSDTEHDDAEVAQRGRRRAGRHRTWRCPAVSAARSSTSPAVNSVCERGCKLIERAVNLAADLERLIGECPAGGGNAIVRRADRCRTPRPTPLHPIVIFGSGPEHGDRGDAMFLRDARGEPLR